MLGRRAEKYYFYHVTMQRVRLNHKLLVGLVLLLSFFIQDVSAQTATGCPANSITIRDKKTGGYQCQACRVCPAGEGLSVNCGDVITPQTPVSCKSCVLGKTYSAANEAGACKDCENCGEYRETTKPCTLTSKAVCGKCKDGAYFEYLLGMCRPCSPCCNDGKDIVVPECQVSGVPANRQCSFLRSEKCSKIAARVKAKGSVSTASTLQITPSAITPSTLYVAAITASPPRTNQVHVPEQVASDPTNAALQSKSTGINNSGGIIGIICGVIGSVSLVAVILFFVCYRINKRKRTRGKKYDSPDMEKDAKERPEQEQGEHGANETVELNPAEDQLEEESPISPIPETGDSQEPVGIQDSQPPGCIDKKDWKSSDLDPEPYCCADHGNTKPAPKMSNEVTIIVKCYEEPGKV